MKIVNLMLDLQKLAKSEQAAIIQISMVEFNPRDNSIGNSFNKHIRITDAEKHGKIDNDKLLFWEEKDISIKTRVFSGKRTLKHVLSLLKDFLNQYNGCKIRVWSNGVSENQTCLRLAYKSAKVALPKALNTKNDMCLQSFHHLMVDLNLPSGTYQKIDLDYDSLYICLNSINVACSICKALMVRAGKVVTIAYVFSNCTFDVVDKTITHIKNGVEHLTLQQAQLLKYLILNRHKVVGFDELFRSIPNNSNATDLCKKKKYLSGLILKLKKTFEDLNVQDTIISLHAHQGFKFESNLDACREISEVQDNFTV